MPGIAGAPVKLDQPASVRRGTNRRREGFRSGREKSGDRGERGNYSTRDCDKSRYAGLAPALVLRAGSFSRGSRAPCAGCTISSGPVDGMISICEEGLSPALPCFPPAREAVAAERVLKLFRPLRRAGRRRESQAACRGDGADERADNGAVNVKERAVALKN
jgi:hypothetical protein